MDFRIVVSDLVDKENKNSVIPFSQIEVREGVFIRDSSHNLLEDPLVGNEGNRFSIPFTQTRRFFLTVDSKSIKPGVYQGEVEVKALDVEQGEPSPSKKVHLEVKIYDIELPDNMPIAVTLFSPDCVPTPASGKYEFYGRHNFCNYTDPAKAIPDNFAHHHVNWVNCTSYIMGLGRLTNNEDELLKWDDEYIKRCRNYGMKVWTSYSISYEKAMKLTKHFKEMGMDYDDFLFQLTDEAHGEWVDKAVEQGRKIKKEDPNIRLTTTRGCTTTMEDLEKFNEVIDVWIPHLNYIYPLTPKNKEELSWYRSTGKPIWIYQCSFPNDIQPIMDYYMLYPWKVWKIGADGLAYWGWGAWAKDPWDKFDWNYYEGDNGMVYNSCSKDRLIDSKRWEAFNEGLEDYLYLYTLDKKIKKSEKKGIDTTKAKEILNDAVDDILTNTNDPENITKWRIKILDEIVKID